MQVSKEIPKAKKHPVILELIVEFIVNFKGLSIGRYSIDTI